MGIKTIMPGVMLREGKRKRAIQFACMINGQRFSCTYDDAPIDVLIDQRSRPTRQLKNAYNAWRTSCEEDVGEIKRYGLREPTLGEMMDAYEKFATERSYDPRFRKPRLRTIANSLVSFRTVMREGGLHETDGYRKLYNEATAKRIFDSLLRPERGLTGVSAWAYICSLQTLAAEWTKPYYERKGYLVKSVKLPDAGLVKDAPRYQRPTQDLIARQDQFYSSLQEREDKRLFLVASMVLQLAMRPEDVAALTAENFVRAADGRIYLDYIPQKTMYSSKRRVRWPVPPALWDRIRAHAGSRLDAGDTLIDRFQSVCHRLNEEMRTSCGMERSTKALYEFRKRCIDYVYHQFGINAAVAISGDNASTIEYYYLDPSMTTQAPQFETVAIGGDPDAGATVAGHGD